MGQIRLVHGDCREGMRDLEENSVDVVVTSPPYNLGVDYGTYDDTVRREDYLDWMREWTDEVKRLLAPGGSFFLNVGSKPSDPWVPHEVLADLRDRFSLQNEIHWVKSIAFQTSSYGEEISVNVGHFKPINSDRYLNQCHEYLFHLTHDGTVELDRLAIGVPYKDKSNIERWESGGRDLRCRGNTWFVDYDTIQDRDEQRPHPASFPPALAENALRLHGAEHIDLVMDPFVGIGNSARAAAKLNLNFVGFEIDEEYVEEARRRLGQVQTELFP